VGLVFFSVGLLVRSLCFVLLPLKSCQASFDLELYRKSVEPPLLHVIGTVQQKPHMRVFWASMISFFLAFLGWVALAPRTLDGEQSMVVCENQLYPPQEFPKRTAYLKYKTLGTLMTYCQ
jgi:hypothetical protein